MINSSSFLWTNNEHMPYLCGQIQKRVSVKHT